MYKFFSLILYIGFWFLSQRKFEERPNTKNIIKDELHNLAVNNLRHRVYKEFRYVLNSFNTIKL
jgi:hypothetical protein